MELRQLTYFEAVVRHGGFGRAAERLRVAQPAVSVQVRKLESELGVELLRRTTRRVELTRAGELFLAHARAVLDELDAARTDLVLLGDGEIGQVRIGAIQALGPFDLSRALADFHARYPQVELSFRTGRTSALLDDLAADRIDLAIAPAPAEPAAPFTAEHLFTDELVLVTAAGHRTAGAGALRVGELRDEPFVCLPAGSGLRNRLDQLAAVDGVTPRVPFETANLPQLRELVEHGLGVALVARSVAEGPGRPLAVHSVDPGPVWRPVHLIHHTARPPAPATNACRQFLLARRCAPPTRGGR